MNIYYISMTSEGATNYADYDTYDSHVVIAGSAQEARELCPSGVEGKGVWLTPRLSLCSLIGHAVGAQEPHAVVSSFNAG